MMNQEERTEYLKLRREKALRAYLQSDRDIISVDDCVALLTDQVHTEPDGSLNPASIKAALLQLRRAGPYLFRSSRADYAMDMQGVPAPAPKSDLELARELFGKHSSAVRAQNLAGSNKKEYLRLRILAMENNII
jgi:hypothetical protein